MIRKLFIPSLRELGYSSGFSLRNPVGFGYAATAPLKVKVTLFRESKPEHTHFIEFQDSQMYAISQEAEWNLPGGRTKPGDLLTAEYVSHADEPLANDFPCEGQLIFASEKTGARASVLLDTVPVRGNGHKYAPIFHNAHYMLSSDLFETYACLLNFNSGQPEALAEANKLEFRILSPKGRTLHVTTRALAYNSTSLLSVSELCLGNQSNGNVTVLARGGASQFAIFSVFLNKSTNAIGIEHSLPPIYYTEAVKHPETRKIFYQKAFGELWN
jgi:hypothetical protein